MPLQTIRYIVTGTNPKTGTIQVSVSPTGSGTATIPLTSSAAGVDTLQTFLDAMSLTSNEGQVVWQGTNGAIAISPISGYTMAGNASGNFPSGLVKGDFGAVQPFNSLMFNTHPQNLLSGDPHQNGNTGTPMVNNAITSSGSYSGDVTVTNSTGAFNMVLTGQFVIATAGQVTFTAYVNSSFLIGVSGAFFVSGTQTLSGVTHTPFNGYPVLAGFNGPDFVFPSANWATSTFTLNFPASGVYNFEVCFTAGIASERQFCLLANSGVIPPVTMTTIPPPPAAAPVAALMSLTPVNAGPDIIGTSQAFTVTLKNLVFDTIPYLPLLESKAGTILLANAAGNVYTIPVPAQGGTIPAAKALASLFTLSGSNNSYATKLSLSWNGTAFVLTFNGAAADANVATTTLTITAEDVAWYDTIDTLFDLYGKTNTGGGSSDSIQIDWLVIPVISSYGPGSVAGTGASYTVNFVFAKPVPPIQNNIAITVVGGTGLTVSTVTLTTNSAGWITGFTAKVTAAFTAVQVISHVTITATGLITYLNGTTFTTGTVTYIEGPLQLIITAG